MTKDEALKLALEALIVVDKRIVAGGLASDARLQMKKAIAALSQALEQPEHQPVAWQSIEDMAAKRYKVVLSHESMFYRHAVVAGDGTQQLYLGRETDCANMARKFAGAFLDGAYASRSANPTTPQAPQPEQEPVAWMYEYTRPDGSTYFSTVLHDRYPHREVGVYAAPKQWVGLTDEDIKEGAKYSWVDFQAFQSVAWWAEAKLREKNGF